MNFNLISPSDNGHQFNVRYNEPIVIPPNASISLNWALFERGSGFSFSQDQIFTYNIRKVLPTHKCQDNTVNGKNDGSLSYLIPKGKYTMEELLTTIAKVQIGPLSVGKRFCGFNRYSRGDASITEGKIEIDNPILNCIAYEYATPKLSNDGSSFVMGFNRRAFKDRASAFPSMDGGVPLANQAGGEIADFDPDIRASYFSKNGTDNNFVAGTGSFVITKEKYLHIGYDMDSYNGVHRNVRVNSENYDEMRGANTVTFKLNKVPEDLEGRVFVGFACEEVSGVKWGTRAAYNQRCHDIDPVHFTWNASLKLIEVTKEDPQDPSVPIIDRLPQNLGGLLFSTNKVAIIGAKFNSVTNCRSDQQYLKVIKEFNYDDLGLVLTGQTNPLFGFQTYRPNTARMTTDGQNPDAHSQLYVRCFWISDAGQTNIFYDSDYVDAREEWVYTKAFQNEFTGLYGDNTHDNEAKRRATVPFNIIMAATYLNEGVSDLAFDMIQFNGNSGNVAGAFDNYENESIVEAYDITMSKQLGNLIQTVSGKTVTLTEKYPSQTTNVVLEAKYGLELNRLSNDTVEGYYQINNVIAQHRLDRYTVYLNELPIKVYQNTSDKSKSGNRRNILSNIPNPYGGADVFSEGGGDVLGSYVPSIGVQNFLGNQLITTNNFTISVRNMDDDTPASQIKRTVVNFSITNS